MVPPHAGQTSPVSGAAPAATLTGVKATARAGREPTMPYIERPQRHGLPPDQPPPVAHGPHRGGPAGAGHVRRTVPGAPPASPSFRRDRLGAVPGARALCRPAAVPAA